MTVPVECAAASSDIIRFHDRCHHRFFNQNIFSVAKRFENNRLVPTTVSDN
jgi:hypothetical protein